MIPNRLYLHLATITTSEEEKEEIVTLVLDRLGGLLTSVFFVVRYII